MAVFCGREELKRFIARKLFPDHKEAIHDESIADAIGLLAAFDKYETRLARLFFGREGESYREGGRWQNYYGGEDPPAVQTRARRLIDTLPAYLDGTGSTEPEAIFRLVCRIEEERAGMAD